MLQLDFLTEFIEEVEKKKKIFQKLYSEESEEEKEAVKAKVQEHWHPIPKKKRQEAPAKYAVDGSRAVRQFANGSEFLVSRALMIGKNDGGNETYKKIFADLYRGPANPELTTRYARLISHLTEIEVISDNLEELPEGSVVYIDGSIHGRYLHSIWPFRLPDREDTPLTLHQRQIELLHNALEKNILLIGISKTSQIRALAKEIERNEPDTELLSRFTSSPGFSTPILLGGYGFASDEYTWLVNDPERFVESISTKALDRSEVRKTIYQLQRSPAIVTFHVRLQENDETIRVDVPAPYLTIDETVSSLKSRALDPVVIEPVFPHIAEEHTSRRVYQALLYTVDKLVRLKSKKVDTVYLKVLQETLGKDYPLELTRSYRRFM